MNARLRRWCTATMTAAVGVAMSGCGYTYEDARAVRQAVDTAATTHPADTTTPTADTRGGGDTTSVSTGGGDTADGDDDDTEADSSGCTTTPCCGNGVIEDGETCDGDCPERCDDGLPCTIDERSGAPETCDVVCSARDGDDGRDSDGDLRSDCAEATDDSNVTDPLVFNGMFATIGEPPAGLFGSANCSELGGSHGAALERFDESTESQNLTSGFAWSADNTADYSDASYDFEPAWPAAGQIGAYNSFQILLQAKLWIPAAGTACFSVDTGAGGVGPADIAGRRNSCGRVYVDAAPADGPVAETGYGSAASPDVGCVAVDAGWRRIDLMARHFQATLYKPRFKAMWCLTSEAGCAPDRGFVSGDLQSIVDGVDVCEAPPCDPEPAPGCGDGKLDEGEACDDGNDNDLDACNTSCLDNDHGVGQACTASGVGADDPDYAAGTIAGCDNVPAAMGGCVRGCLRSIDPGFGQPRVYNAAGYCTLLALECEGNLCSFAPSIGDYATCTACPEGSFLDQTTQTPAGLTIRTKACLRRCETDADCRTHAWDDRFSEWGRYECAPAQSDASVRVCRDVR